MENRRKYAVALSVIGLMLIALTAREMLFTEVHRTEFDTTDEQIFIEDVHLSKGLYTFWIAGIEPTNRHRVTVHVYKDIISGDGEEIENILGLYPRDIDGVEFIPVSRVTISEERDYIVRVILHVEAIRDPTCTFIIQKKPSVHVIVGFYTGVVQTALGTVVVIFLYRLSKVKRTQGPDVS